MDREKVIKEFELFIKGFHPACTSEGVELDMFREVLALLKEQKDEKPVLDEFGRCFLNALKRQLDMKLQMIELLITPEFAEKVVELIEEMFD